MKSALGLQSVSMLREFVGGMLNSTRLLIVNADAYGRTSINDKRKSNKTKRNSTILLHFLDRGKVVCRAFIGMRTRRIQSLSLSKTHTRYTTEMSSMKSLEILFES